MLAAMVIEELPTALRPVDACGALLDLPYCLLLDSAGDVTPVARYSYLTADPFLVVTADAAGLSVQARGERAVVVAGDPFLIVRDLLQRYRLPVHEGVPPFQGGAAGYWAYELGRSLERLPGRAVEDLPLPRLSVGFYDWVLAHDRARERSWIVAMGFPDGTTAAAQRRVAWVHDRLSRPSRRRAARGALARRRLDLFPTGV